MSPGPVRCVLLDLGRVLVDFNLEPFRAVMENLTGMGEDGLRAALLSDGLPHRYETGVIGDVEFHQEVCRKLGKDVPFDTFGAAWNSVFLESALLPDAWLATISARAPIWIGSNTNPLHFRFIRDRYSFFPFVRGCILSYEVGVAKPDARIFRIALERADCEPDEAVFADDQTANVTAAAEMGIDAFLFSSPGQFERAMRARGLL
jgi:glucose-1-phosphatase